MKKVLLASCFVALAAMAGAKTIYVSPSGSASADGSTWATAVNSLPAALSLSAVGDEIWMAGGEYVADATINILPGVDIYGGFAGTESSIDERVRPDAENAPWQFANETVLKGSFVGRLIDHEDKTTVWEGDNAVTIDGIVVDGHDAGDNDKILFLRSNFTVRNFQLRNCFVGGKGLYFEIGGTAVDCLFSGNAQSSTTTRADIYAAQGRECLEGNRPGNTYDHCIFENNSITSLSIYNTMSNGGDVYEGETAVKNCIFRNNTASCLSVNSQWPAATGEYGDGARTLVVEDNLFEGNVASCNASGSVLHCNGTSICDFSRNIVRNNQNTAPQEGADGAFRSSIIYINAAGWMSNNLIVNNSSTGLLLYMNSGQLVNSTVANNVGSVYATQGSYATLYNSIVLNNTPTNNDLEIVIADAGSFFMNNCALTTDVTGGDEAYIIGNIVVPADGTFKAPTTFVGADAAQAEAIAAADFSLADGSACIGAGDPDYENSLFMNQTWINRFMSYDLAMNSRLTDGAVNIGAYEGDAINGIAGSNVAAADLATVYVDGNVLTRGIQPERCSGCPGRCERCCQHRSAAGRAVHRQGCCRWRCSVVQGACTQLIGVFDIIR